MDAEKTDSISIPRNTFIGSYARSKEHASPHTVPYAPRKIRNPRNEFGRLRIPGDIPLAYTASFQLLLSFLKLSSSPHSGMGICLKRTYLFSFYVLIIFP